MCVLRNFFYMEGHIKHKTQDNDYLEEDYVEKHRLLSIL